MTNYGGIAGEQLREIVQRIEKLNDEKAELTSYIADVYTEAKAKGFDVKIIREIIKIRKKDKEKHEEEQQLIDLYAHALGMASDNKETDSEDL